MKYNNIRYDEESFRIKVEPDKVSRIDTIDDFSEVFHEDIEIKFFIDGSSTLHIGGESLVTQPEDIVVINPYEFHSTVNYAEEKGRYHLLMISLDFFDGMGEGFLDLRYLFTKERARLETLVRDGRIARAIKDIVLEMTEMREGYQRAVTALVLELFVLLLRDFKAPTPAIMPSDKSIRYYEIVYPAIRLIRQDCGAEHSIDELAEACGVSKCHFCRIFKQSTSMSAVEYRNGYRLEIAGVLLRSTSKSISEIATQCGFEDAAYFSRCYKKKYGHSPNKDRAILSK